MPHPLDRQDWYGVLVERLRQRHLGRLDALGAPYWQHFDRVARRLVRLFPHASTGQVQAALFHDILEPGEGQVADLSPLGLDAQAVGIIRRITLPQDGRSYLDYIAGLAASGDIAAIEVKLADNLDATEFYGTRATPEAQALLEDTYNPSRRLLQDALIRAAGHRTRD